jgi:hypothetical protein
MLVFKSAGTRGQYWLIGSSRRSQVTFSCKKIFVEKRFDLRDLKDSLFSTLALYNICALQRKGRWESNINVWFLYVCERFIYFQDRSAYSATGKYVDRSWEYINRSQKHECGIGTEATRFPEEEYINGIFLAVWLNRKWETKLFNLLKLRREALELGKVWGGGS